MGRLLLLAALVCVLAAAGVVAAGGVEPSAEQRAERAREAARPFVVPGEADPLPPAPRTRRVRARAAGPVGATVTMERLHFGTRRVEVAAGQSVRWVNRDVVPHALLADDAEGAGSVPSFDSGTIARGGAFRTTFDAPGRIRYVCVLHPTSMVAEVVVRER